MSTGLYLGFHRICYCIFTFWFWFRLINQTNIRDLSLLFWYTIYQFLFYILNNYTGLDVIESVYSFIRFSTSTGRTWIFFPCLHGTCKWISGYQYPVDPQRCMLLASYFNIFFLLGVVLLWLSNEIVSSAFVMLSEVIVLANLLWRLHCLLPQFRKIIKSYILFCLWQMGR